MQFASENVPVRYKPLRYERTGPGEALDGKKVVLVDSDHSAPWRQDADWVWNNLFRGNQFILMDGYVDYRNGAPPQPDPEWDATRQAMGRARALAERIDLATLSPQSELASSGYCLANLPRHKAQYLAYLPQGGEVTLDLSAAKGLLKVEWTATKSGETHAGPPVSGGSRRQFVAPLAGPAILRLVASEEGE